MRKIRRFVALAAVSVMLAMSLMGCSNKKGADATGGNAGADGKDMITLRMWGGVPPEPALKQCVTILMSYIKIKV